MRTVKHRLVNIPFTPLRQSPLADGLRNGETKWMSQNQSRRIQH